MSEYIKLLISRESKVVLGKYYGNLWLLTIVLVATCLSIAFSNGSMIYLSDKMNDPFTNWVSITKAIDDATFTGFSQSLEDQKNKEHYKYSDVQMDQYTNYTFQGVDEKHQHYLECRFFERLNTPLMHAILSEDNLIDGCVVDTTLLEQDGFGLVLTMDVVKKLGYSEKNLPSYIYYLAYSVGADSIGVKLIADKFFPVPLPVLAVVKKLPNNVDLVASNFFYAQQHLNDASYPFDFCYHEEYQHQLTYFVPADLCEKFKNEIKALIPDSLQKEFDVLDNNEMTSWKPGEQISIYIGNHNTTNRSVYQKIAKKIEHHFDTNQIQRIYHLELKDCSLIRGTYLSIAFNSLDSIRAFERYAKDNFQVQLEMEQVSSKENFNAVSVMAGILSWAMIIFSIVCIVLFIINMLQSYFQKVKRNLGTFKAFGVSSRSLINAYVLILFVIVIVAVMIAVMIAWAVELSLPYLGLMKDGTFNYLSLWSMKLLYAVIIIIVSSLATVQIVMSKMLHRTPGDLIYDR